METKPLHVNAKCWTQKLTSATISARKLDASKSSTYVPGVKNRDTKPNYTATFSVP